MTPRILRIELRRSSAPSVIALVAVLGAAMMYVVLPAWGGRWMPAALMQREYMFILVPFGLAAGAWQARREPTSKVGELFTSTPRPRWQRVIPTAGAMATAAAVGYLAMFAAVAAQVAATATYGTAAVVPVVAIGALGMVAAVWLGLAVGTAVPSRFTAPALVVIGVGGFLWLVGHGGRAALATSILSRAGDFSAIAGSVHLGQGVWLVALAAGALTLYAASSWRGRAAAAAPAAVGLLAVLAILPGDPADQTVPDPRAASLVCTDDAPKVCVTKVHQAALPYVRGPAREALRILAANFPDAPTSAAESTVSWNSAGARPASTGVLSMDVQVDSRGRLATSSGALLRDLLDGGGTRPCNNIFTLPGENPVGRHHAGRAVVGAWLLADANPPTGAGRARVGFTDKLIEEGSAALRALPAAEQRKRVLAVRASAAACDGRDLLKLIAPEVGVK